MAVETKELYVASELASMCGVDLKTIHNWVAKGSLAAFRTPGRHLRFKAADVVAFLTTFGYPVPDAVAASVTHEAPKGEAVAPTEAVLTDEQKAAVALWEELPVGERRKVVGCFADMFDPSPGRRAALALFAAFKPKDCSA